MLARSLRYVTARAIAAARAYITVDAWWLPAPLAIPLQLADQFLYKHNCSHNQPRRTDDATTNADGIAGRVPGIGAGRPFYFLTEPSNAPYPCSVADVAARLVERRGAARLVPPGSINSLAMAWIQFMVHDWLDHEPGTNVNRRAPFWDGSHIYGDSAETQRAVRSYEGGCIHLPYESGTLNVGMADNHWFGLHVLHDLFAREHNHVARQLARRYPEMTDARLFRVAQLVVTAMIARIHIIEWTPALFANAATVRGQEYLLGGMWRVLTGTSAPAWLRAARCSELTGALGGAYECVDFTHPEEFVAAYRFHAMLPDTFRVGKRTYTLTEIHDWRRICYEECTLDECMRHLLTESPAELGLHNTPRAVVSTQGAQGAAPREVNFAVIDVARNRERKLPRFNQLRSYIGLRPLASIDELVPPWSEDNAVLRELYGTVDEIDLHVGLLAEARMPRCAVGETTYAIFQVQTDKRIRCDPFFTKFYDEAYYTRAGMELVERATMRDIIERHYPALDATRAFCSTPKSAMRKRAYGDCSKCPRSF